MSAAKDIKQMSMREAIRVRPDYYDKYLDNLEAKRSISQHDLEILIKLSRLAIDLTKEQ